MAIKSYKSKHTGEHIELLLDNMQEIVEVKDDIVLAKDVIEDIQNLDATIIERVAKLEQRVIQIEDVSETASMVKELDKKFDNLSSSVEALKTDVIQPLKNKVNEVVSKVNILANSSDDLERRVTSVEGKIEIFATEEEINEIVK